MLIQPKPFLEKLRLRRHACGTEQRRNMSKLILEHGTPFPKSIEYSDIDNAMFKWVDEKIDIVYDGKKLPTYKLYSTQRLSEYLQSWDKQDDTGNLIINFKTVTRELNPQRGESQGNYFNIPGHKDFAMFYVPVLQENGIEAYDKYTMKQPFQVNFIYSVSIISNKMEVINDMNEKMHYEFSAINCYISPNDHPMSMTLDDVSDESEYTIDDRKYYSQTYKIKVRGYIIRKEDYKIERIPSRLVMASNDSDASGIVNKRGKNRTNDEKVVFLGDNTKNDDTRPSEIVEEEVIEDCKPKEPRYFNKLIKVMMNFDCVKELVFIIDKEMILESIEMTNVHDFKILVNGELVNLESDVKFYGGDEITVRISRENLHEKSEMTLIGLDPYTVYDKEADPEVAMDEKPIEEEVIMINYEEENENDN